SKQRSPPPVTPAHLLRYRNENSSGAGALLWEPVVRARRRGDAEKGSAGAAQSRPGGSPPSLLPANPQVKAVEPGRDTAEDLLLSGAAEQRVAHVEDRLVIGRLQDDRPVAAEHQPPGAEHLHRVLHVRAQA